MAQIIIHPNEYETVTVLSPCTDCGLTVSEIAQKDVPAGIPYLIIDDTDLPSDRDFRNAWEADFTTPDGTGIGADAWFEAHPPEPDRRPGPREGYVPGPEPEPEPMPIVEPEPMPAGPGPAQP